MRTFEEGLGRIIFVAGTLEHERSFLGSPYKFLTMHPLSSVRRVLPYVAFVLRFLSRCSVNRHYDCNAFLEKSGVAPRVDAQASSTRTGIGGWFPHTDENGKVDLWKSPWSSLEVTREGFPWTNERGNKPSLLISTLEALAVLTAMKLYCGDAPGDNPKSVTLVPTFTDNRGNGAALNKLMSGSRRRPC